MEKLTLKEFADRFGQESAASALGVKQSAISKAIRVKRNVTVTLLKDGAASAEEIKPFPSQRLKGV
jgi:predicted XRE-type DNA-binding protein